MQTLRQLAFSRTFPRTALRPLVASRTFAATARKMVVHNIETQAAWDAAIKEQGVMVVDFFAVWCGPCKMIAPKVVEASGKHTSARFYKVDVDELPDIAQEYSIRAMPTFIVFKDGKKAEEVVGANVPALEAAIVGQL